MDEAVLGIWGRLMLHGPDILGGLVFMLATIIASKLVFAAFSMGHKEPRLLGIIICAQFAVLPPRVLIYALFAYGFFWPLNPVVGICCAAIVFCVMAVVEWQLYQHAGATDNPLMLSVILNIAYLVVLVGFCAYTGYLPFPVL